MGVLNEIISIREASSILGLKETTLRWHIAQGNFKKGIDCRKFGSTWIFDKAAIERVFDTNLNICEYRISDYDNIEDLIMPNDFNKDSNLIGYMPTDYIDSPPRLIIDNNTILGFFRGYWIGNLYNKESQYRIYAHIPESERNYNIKYKIPHRAINDFKKISDAINFLIKDSGLEERYFSESELEVIEKWFKDSIQLFSCEWDYIKDIEMK